MPGPQSRLARVAHGIAAPRCASARGTADAHHVDPPQTPMDVKLGLTKAADIAHPLRWGIISASKIASDWIKCLADVPGATVVACAARDGRRAEDYAAAHGIEKSYSSYEALVADPEVRERRRCSRANRVAASGCSSP